MNSEKMIRDIVMKVKRQDGGGSHGEMAIFNLINAMIECGLTSSACGTLGGSWLSATRNILNDQEALDRIAREYWWGEVNESIPLT